MAQSHNSKPEVLHSDLHFTESWQDKVSEKLTKFFGTTTFFVAHIFVFIGWILWNSLSNASHFDPYPYTLLTLVTSIEAIFLATIVLMSQNRDARIATTRSKLDFEIDVRSEAEVTKILKILERVQDHLKIKHEVDTDLEWMKKDVNIDDLRKRAEETAE